MPEITTLPALSDNGRRRPGSTERAPAAARAAAKPPDEEEDEDEDGAATPAKPGTIGRERVKAPDPVPNQTKKARRSPTQLTPDYEIPLTPKASIGGYSEVGRMQLENRVGRLPGVRAHDAGGGLTLQYRFGE